MNVAMCRGTGPQGPAATVEHKVAELDEEYVADSYREPDESNLGGKETVSSH